MITEQSRWNATSGWSNGTTSDLNADLVVIFGSRDALGSAELRDQLRQRHPSALLFGCSTAGEISGTEVLDDSIVATAVKFEATPMAHSAVSLHDASKSFTAGEELAAALDHNGLAHVVVLSKGVNVNGSELVKGLTKTLPGHVTVTGGLAGDGAAFEKTLVLHDDRCCEDCIAAIGLYGERIRVGYASLGGWDGFGPERIVTRSEGNVLYELDGKSALELYRKYLGEHAEGLPATGLLFPLCIRSNDTDPGVVRTILAIDERKQSITFAGDIEEGAYARLMKANFDRLIDGAVGAARSTHAALDNIQADLALLISCVGRKMVLKQRVEEEVEGVQEILGAQTTLTGFYSYGEISPFTPRAKCELHNQTMTITAFGEAG